MENIYQDIPRIYTAIAEWLACLIYCLVLKRKVSKKLFVLISVAALVWQCIFLVLTKNLSLFFWVPCMLMAVLFMFLYMMLVCDDTANVIGYYCARAFLLAEFAASLEWQLACFQMGFSDSKITQIVILVVIYALVFVWALHMEKSITRGIFQLEINARELIAAILIAAAVRSGRRLRSSRTLRRIETAASKRHCRRCGRSDVNSGGRTPSGAIIAQTYMFRRSYAGRCARLA